MSLDEAIKIVRMLANVGGTVDGYKDRKAEALRLLLGEIGRMQSDIDDLMAAANEALNSAREPSPTASVNGGGDL